MSTIKLKRINSEAVHPIKFPDDNDTRKIKGQNLFDEIYANIGLIARKKSGKTNVISKILDDCSNKETTIICFVSTFNKDKNYRYMKKYFTEKGIPFLGYTSMYDENGENRLTALIRYLENKAEQREKGLDEKEEPKDELVELTNQLGHGKIITNQNEVEYKEKKQRKPKTRAPEYIFVFDDLSHELKDSALTELLMKNRHFFCKILLSTQYIHHIPIQSLKQLDYWLLWSGQPLVKLEKIYKDADLSVNFDTFVKLYKNATKERFHFFYIDTVNEQFRKDFCKKYELNEHT